MVKSVLQSLKDLRRQTEERLVRESDDYRALTVLDETIRKLERQSSPPNIGVIGVGATSNAVLPFMATLGLKQISQPDAAAAALVEAGEPLAIHELMEAARAKGAVVKGKRPHINLSSSLSRDKRFRTVRYRDRSAWWLRDRPYPDELGDGFPAAPAADKESAGPPSKQDPADLPF